MAELKVAVDLVARGYQVAFPYGEDWDYDLILCRGERLERVQQSHGTIVVVRCRSASLTNGKVRVYKYYTAETVDWIAVYDKTSDRCYYVPSGELGEGRCQLSLRLAPARNAQLQGIRLAQDYTAI